MIWMLVTFLQDISTQKLSTTLNTENIGFFQALTQNESMAVLESNRYIRFASRSLVDVFSREADKPNLQSLGYLLKLSYLKYRVRSLGIEKTSS